MERISELPAGSVFFLNGQRDTSWMWDGTLAWPTSHEGMTPEQLAHYGLHKVEVIHYGGHLTSAERERLILTEESDAEETLAKAIGYPAANPDDIGGPTPWPHSATTGDHTLLTLAQESAGVVAYLCEQLGVDPGDARRAAAAHRSVVVERLTPASYQEGTGATAVYPGAGTVEGFTDYVVHGLVGEVSELYEAVKHADEANIRKEIGDVLWYVAQAHTCLRAVLDPEGFGHPEHWLVLFEGVERGHENFQAIALDRLIIDAGAVSEQVKKAKRDDEGELFPGRRVEIMERLALILTCTKAIADCWGFDVADCAQANLDKLAKRQADGTISGSGNDR